MAYINVDNNKSKRDIKYLNRDFSNFRSQLINFSKRYFPDTFNDFSPSSPGMIFIEMASYVGDVMSFYLDNQIQENFLQYARQSNNIFELAYMFGYKPKVTAAASVNLDFFQQVPAIYNGSTYSPDYSYAVKVLRNTVIREAAAAGAVDFLLLDDIDFSISSSLDPTEVTVYEVTGTTPSYYLLKKTRSAISATLNTQTYDFDDPIEFDTRTLNDNNIIGILDVFDSDGNQYYEVDYLGQETIFKKIKNTNINNPYYSNDDTTSYILKTEKVQRRFATRFLDTSNLQIQFGAGKAADDDEEIIPNQNNVGIGLPFGQSRLFTAYSPKNFIFTDTYGIAPSNTTLTVRYLVGGGVASNVAANRVTQLNKSLTQFINQNLDATLANYVFRSVACNNPVAATGGQDGDTLQEIRQNTIANYGTQLRNVTLDDYIVRSLSMPPEYGSISKVYAEIPKIDNTTFAVARPTAENFNNVIKTINLYTLSSDGSNKLINTSPLVKENLRTYLNEYRMLGDSVEVRDAYIVNIAVDFDIVVLPNYNSNFVIGACIERIIEYFKIDNWQINQPILLKDLSITLDKVDGVQIVNNVSLSNKYGEQIGYSQYAYDLQAATINDVIYPSLDPMIFELKYPNNDIRGRVVNF